MKTNLLLFILLVFANHSNLAGFDLPKMNLQASIAAPQIDLEDQYFICDGQSFILDGGNAVAGVTYEWKDLSDNTTIATSRKFEVKQPGVYRLTVTIGSESAAKDFIVDESFTPSIEIDSKPYLLCMGNTLTFDAGNEGATFLWINDNSGDTISRNQTATIAYKGKYTIIATTPCGMSMKKIVVDEIAYPDLNIVPSVGYLCEGGSSTVDAKNYDSKAVWIDTITGDTLAQTKSITLEATGGYKLILYNQCDTVSKIVSIVPREFPVINLEDEMYICNAEPIFLDAGNEGAEYEWINVETKAVVSNAQILEVNKVGKYSIKVIDPCGVAFDTVAVSKAEAPTLYLNSQYSICGEHAEEISPNLPGVDYEWKENNTTISTASTFTPPNPGNYSLTATNGCGSDSKNFTVVEGFIPEILIPDELTVHVLGGSYILDAGNEGAEFAWIEVATGEILSDSQTLEVTKSGEYILSVHTICGGYDKPFSINLITGVNDKDEAQNAYKVYPNPGSQAIQIKFLSDNREKASIFLSSLTGNIVLEPIELDLSTSREPISIDVSEIPAGIYILTIKGKGTYHTKLVIN